MKSRLIELAALGALAFPLSAFAASETLDYTSSAFTGAWSSGSFVGEVGVGSYFTAALTLNAPLAANLHDANLSSDVTSLVFTTFNPSAPSLTLSAIQAEGSQFSFSTNSAGAITGWNFTAGLTNPSLTNPNLDSSADVLFHSCSNESCSSGTYNNQGYGATGDWYDYKPGSSTASDGCTYTPAGGCGSGSGSVGKWVVAAPELDTMNAASGLFLLIGSIAVLRGRRKGNGYSD